LLLRALLGAYRQPSSAGTVSSRSPSHLLEYMTLNERGGGGGNGLRGVFENFFRVNKILCVNPDQIFS